MTSPAPTFADPTATPAGLLSVETECTRIDDDGECKIVRLAGEIDLSTIETLHRAFEQEPQPGTSALIVDLSAVRFSCSVGLRALLELRDRADRACVPLELVIAHDNGMLRRMLNVLGDLDDFSTHPDLHTARAWLQPSWEVAALHGMPTEETTTWPCPT